MGITVEQVVDTPVARLEVGDEVGSATEAWYVVIEPPVCPKPDGTLVRVQFAADGGISTRQFDTRTQAVPVRRKGVEVPS